jgi:hypothetical protein
MTAAIISSLVRARGVVASGQAMRDVAAALRAQDEQTF